LAERETSRFPSKEHPHMPGSPTTPGRPGTRARAPVRVAFRDLKRVGTRDLTSFAAQWLARALPADASLSSSRVPTHGSRPRWFATPSSWRTCTPYSLPVSRRTQIKFKLLQVTSWTAEMMSKAVVLA
jgi:hypothetical protein